jgi:hypothetical protein
MRSFGYDVAPVREERPHRYVDLLDVADSTRAVTDIAKPIDISLLVTAELPLVDAIRAFATARYFFVLESNRLAGVVTWSDLQRPAVSMVLFSLVLAAEQAMSSLIGASYGQDWESHLPASRRRFVRGIFDQRRRHNTEISMLECLMLEDRLRLVAKKTELLRSLNFGSRATFERWANKLKKVRNVLAHGGGLLDAERNPSLAVGLFNDVRQFTEGVWTQAAIADRR